MIFNEELKKPYISNKQGKKFMKDHKFYMIKFKKKIDKRVKEDDFFIGDQVLRWDSWREDKGKHGKFEFLWQGRYVIYGYRGNNSFFIRKLD